MESTSEQAPVTAHAAHGAHSVSSTPSHGGSAIHMDQRQIYKGNPRIYYMNGESLSRPFEIPKGERHWLFIAVGIAAVIAAIFVFMFLDATSNAPAREQKAIEAELAKPVTLGLPDILGLVPLDDAAIDARVKETGDTFFDRRPVGSGDVYQIVKLPSDVTLAEAAEMYALGVSKLSAAKAVELLNGSWDLTIDRKKGLNMSLHYADFKAATLADAITGAINAEGFDRAGEPDRGEDDGYGNAYATGSANVGDGTYIWTVSACPLKQVYSIAGMPDNAVYVGIRVKDS